MSLIRFVLTPVFLGVTFLVFYADYAFGTVNFTKSFTLIISCLALHELFAMYKKRDPAIYEPIAYPCLALSFFADFLTGLIVFFAAMAIISITSAKRGLDSFAKVVFFFCYVSFLSLAFQAGKPGNESLPWFFLFIVASNKGHDSAAYLVGKSIGKTQLTAISPRKTVEGLIGGLMGGAIFGYAAVVYSPLSELFTDVLTSIVACFAVTLAASLGDLFESWLKRGAGVKGSSALIPEFGGFLDLLDGFLLSVPVAYLLFRYVI